MSGYSQKPLSQKLGIKPGMQVVALGAPGSYAGRLARSLADDGILWISWRKKSSGVAIDLNEDLVRSP